MKLMTLIASMLLIVGGAFILLQQTKQTSKQKVKKTMQETKFNIIGTKYPFQLPELKYAYDALEPHIDKETMTLHHTKHHQGYTNNLNTALEKYPDLQSKTIEELLVNLDALPQEIAATVRNNGGGYFNHALFFDMMAPNASALPEGTVAQAINTNFGSFAKFKEQFDKAAISQFGSGWAWLCMNKSKELIIISTPNQDGPLERGLFPILALDVWEHAYYLKYQNKRPEYLTQWWNVINWNYVEKMLELADKTL